MSFTAKPLTCRGQRKLNAEWFSESANKSSAADCSTTGTVNARSRASGCESFLRASHIKPWADCDTDAERLDIFNGLLLAPHLDAAFDSGFVTISDDGSVLLSDGLSPDARSTLGIDGSMKIRGLHQEHERYLPWHRSQDLPRRHETPEPGVMNEIRVGWGI